MRRRLEVTLAGRWFLLLCVALGVTAMVSGNNVLYLVESLLLALLVVSGLLSEWVISRAEVSFVRKPAIAGRVVSDRIEVENRGWFPLLFLEIGEWRDKKFERTAWVPALGPRTRITVPSFQSFAERGRHDWEGYALATSFPFGFARKLRIEKEPGSRLVWPALAPPAVRRANDENQAEQRARRPRKRRGETLEPVDGEVRLKSPEEDARGVVWTLSARGTDLWVRKQELPPSNRQWSLDLRTARGARFEAELCRVAGKFYKSSADGALVMVGRNRRRRIDGRRRVLDELALAQAEGEG